MRRTADDCAFWWSSFRIGIILDRAEAVEGGIRIDLSPLGGGSITVLGDAPEAGDFLLSRPRAALVPRSWPGTGDGAGHGTENA